MIQQEVEKPVCLSVCPLVMQTAQRIRPSPSSSPSRSWQRWSNSSSSCRTSRTSLRQNQQNQNHSTLCPQVHTGLGSVTTTWSSVYYGYSGFWSSMCFPEGLAPADSLNDPAAESNGHELTSSSAVTSAVARLASTFGPTPPMTPSPAKSQTPAALNEATNGVAVTAGVGGDTGQSYKRDITVMLMPC